MSWLWVGAAWLVLAVVIGVLIGRGIALADRKQRESAAGEATTPNFVVDLDGSGPRPAAASEQGSVSPAEFEPPPQEYGRP